MASILQCTSKPNCGIAYSIFSMQNIQILSLTLSSNTRTGHTISGRVCLSVIVYALVSVQVVQDLGWIPRACFNSISDWLLFPPLALSLSLSLSQGEKESPCKIQMTQEDLAKSQSRNLDPLLLLRYLQWGGGGAAWAALESWVIDWPLPISFHGTDLCSPLLPDNSIFCKFSRARIFL